ncbi:hypothetical protein EVAR_34628_1 [Eumeta japonica]|uniref:Uncharacterized protein n=1 Tax=Eumeta variegata TaxID=151549 RepID=A0A4C1VGX5_EUMVA|nr:hypothetical protein EVAR_34628_1 [Eumeta japonica]
MGNHLDECKSTANEVPPLPTCPRSSRCARRSSAPYPIIYLIQPVIAIYVSNAVVKQPLAHIQVREQCARPHASATRAMEDKPAGSARTRQTRKLSKESPFSLNYVKIWRIFSSTMMAWPREKHKGKESTFAVVLKALQPVVFAVAAIDVAVYTYKYQHEVDFTTRGQLYIAAISGGITLVSWTVHVLGSYVIPGYEAIFVSRRVAKI